MNTLYLVDIQDLFLRISASKDNRLNPISSTLSSLRSKSSGSPGIGWRDSRSQPPEQRKMQLAGTVKDPLATGI